MLFVPSEAGACISEVSSGGWGAGRPAMAHLGVGAWGHGAVMYHGYSDEAAALWYF